jgi:hypothetical protein
MTKHKPWTAADDAELVLMREARTPTKEIAIALGRTPSAVMNRISAKGIPYGKELTFSEVVDQAFAKHEIEFGEPDKVDAAYEHFKEQLYPNGVSDIHASLQKNKPKTNAYGFGRLPEMLEQMERDIKRKPQWFKAMMWWRK